MVIERILADSEKDFVVKSADFIEEKIVQYQHTRAFGSFVLGLSGGNSHQRRGRLSEVLETVAKRGNIDWGRIIVFLVEERYGFTNEEDCNANLVRSALLRNLSKNGLRFPEGNFLAPDTTISPIKACADDYCRRLTAVLEQENGPHLVTIGLGADLHIASVFPDWYRGHPERWAEAIDKKVGVLCTETEIYEVRHRITINLRVIRKAHNIMVFVHEGMAEAYKRVKEAFESERYTERRVKRQKVLEPTGVHIGPDGSFMLQATRSRREKIAEPPPLSPLDYVLKYSNVSVMQMKLDEESHCTIVVLGAAGDLARKKTFPSLFQLHLGRLLRSNTSIIACDDTTFHKDLSNTDDFWEKRIRKHLEAEKGWGPCDLAEFRSRLSFLPISINHPPSLAVVDARIRELAGGRPKDNRVFYLALPSFLFEKAIGGVRQHVWSQSGFCRVIVEKPFGKNGNEARELSDKLKKHLNEAETYRIDHYLAKTLVLNLLTLRFANREMGSLFHSQHVANVRITFKEAIGVSGRAGYFDSYGIIRDIMQNHLMQVLTLVAMEAPASLEAEDVRDEKVKVLKQIRPICPRDCVIGQYEGYQDDPDIQKLNAERGYASRCNTFAVCVLYLDNERWSGVPFIMKAGKALEAQHTIVRVQFKKAPPNSLFGDQPQNELVIRIQPNEAIYYKILAKLPGLTQGARDVQQTVLDLDLKKRFELRRTPEAYEKLIHDVIQGESHNFVRRDELEQAWRIFDPLLDTLENVEKRVPERYAMGSRGPLKADTLIDRMGFRRYTVTGVPGFAEDDFD